MKASLACLPCIVNQILLVAQKAGTLPPQKYEILTGVIDQLTRLNLDRSPAEIASDCLALGYRLVGVKDPFAADKKAQHDYALKMLARAAKQLNQAPDRFWLALKYAINGNLIDSLVLRNEQPTLSLRKMTHNPFGINDHVSFKRSLRRARRVLYILDNMGEAVFDKLVVEALKARGKRVTCVVRAKPVLNDVVLQDANIVGFNKIGPVINPGVRAIGLPLHQASRSFKRIFQRADLVLSKGQANFETLEGVKKDGLFFLFVVKCNTVARHLRVKPGNSILMRNKPA